MILTKKQTGFTIVETLIVVGVTGAMFISTTLLIRGQIARQQYNTSMQNVQNMIQKEINSVSTGYFPDVGVADCTGNNAVNNDGNLGTQNNCVIIGKRIHLLKSDPGGLYEPHPETLKVDTLVYPVSDLPFNKNDSAKVGKIVAVSKQDIILPSGITYNQAAYANPTDPVDNNGDEIIINVLYSSIFNISKTENNVVGGGFINNDIGSSSQPVRLYANNYDLLTSHTNGGEGRIACFTDGARYGSVSFGNSNSSFVLLKNEDGRCKF